MTSVFSLPSCDYQGLIPASEERPGVEMEARDSGAGGWGWGWELRVACIEKRARAGVPKVVQTPVNICIFQME